jgi:hypothetical protein
MIPVFFVDNYFDAGVVLMHSTVRVDHGCA